MENTKKKLAPSGGELVNHENVKLTPVLKTEQLLTATQEHWKVEYLATIESGFLDRFMHWINPFGNENQTYYIYKFDRK